MEGRLGVLLETDMRFKIATFAKERIIAAFLSGEKVFLEVARLLNINSHTVYTIVSPVRTNFRNKILMVTWLVCSLVVNLWYIQLGSVSFLMKV